MQSDPGPMLQTHVYRSPSLQSLGAGMADPATQRNHTTSGTIQIYLIYQAQGSGMRVETFRAIQAAHRRWIALSHRREDVSGLLFLGLGYPSLSEVSRITSGWPGRMLVAESCRWSLPPSLSTFDHAVDELPGCTQHPRMACYLGGSGWVFGAQNTRKGPPQIWWELNRGGGDGGDEDIFNLAELLPIWALDVPVDHLPLPSACRLVLRRNGLKELKDLSRFTKADALRWRGFGQKSLKHLSEAVRAFLAKRAEELRAPCSAPEPVLDLRSMMCLVRFSLSAMSQRDAAIWKARLGLDEPRQTLKQIAEAHQLTTERVRQIEFAIAKDYQSQNPWVNAIVPRIKEVAEAGYSRVHFEDVEREDQWFAGISAAPQVLINLLKHFGTPELGVSADPNGFVITSRNGTCSHHPITQLHIGN